MHMCVCLIILNFPRISCNLLIYPSIVRKRCYTARTRIHETSYVHAAYETSTPVVPTSFIEVLSLILELFSFDFFCQYGWNLDVYLFMCVSSFSSLYVTYVHNLINCLFSAPSLGPALARRLFLRGNSLI